MATNLLFKGQRFIGIIPPTAFRTLTNPKRLMLMFDGLALDLTHKLHPFENKVLETAANEISYLSNEGLLTTLDGLKAQYGEHKGSTKPGVVEGGFWIGQTLTQQLNTWNRAVGGESGFGGIENDTGSGINHLRHTASGIRLNNGVDAVAVPSENEPYHIDGKADRETVIRITLNNFPSPSDTTPWENILDFKKDKKANEQHLRLKQWINDVATKEKKAFEIEDELRSYMASYEGELQIREKDVKRNTLQIIITATADALQNLARLKFGDAAKAFFDISKQPLLLLEEEKKVPGREIAYLVTAQHKFAR